MYLSRLRLSKAPGNAALSSMLDPKDASRALGAHHQLLWTVFGDREERERDFLFRPTGNGGFMVLSQRPPAEHPLFEPHQTKTFDPDMAVGDKFAFILRVNATRTIGVNGRDENGRFRRGRRFDPVLEKMKDMSERERRERRLEAAQEAGEEWMSDQGKTNGFDLLDLQIESYQTLVLPRREVEERRNRTGRGKEPKVGVLEMQGALEITDVEAFRKRLAAGFGRAKAFGLGMMMIKPLQ